MVKTCRHQKTQEQILEEISRCCPDDLTSIIKRKNHTADQRLAIDEAWSGLLFWRRTHVKDLVKAYD